MNTDLHQSLINQLIQNVYKKFQLIYNFDELCINIIQNCVWYGWKHSYSVCSTNFNTLFHFSFFKGDIVVSTFYKRLLYVIFHHLHYLRKKFSTMNFTVKRFPRVGNKCIAIKGIRQLYDLANLTPTNKS